MAYKVIILYQLYMPSYFLGTFTEYPYLKSIIFFQHLNVSFSPITIFSTIILFWDRTDASSCVPSSYRQGRST